MLQKRIGKWQLKTFPASNEFSKIKHLRHEIEELEEAIKNGSKEEVSMELADCVFFLLGIAQLQGINLIKSVRKKFKINKKRSWGRPDNNGVYFHKK